MKKVLVEAMAVGASLAIFNRILKNVTRHVKFHTYPEDLLYMFFLGASFHMLCELFGVNKWYCKNGNACRLNM